MGEPKKPEEVIPPQLAAGKRVMEVRIDTEGRVIVLCMLTEPCDLMRLIGDICKALSNFLKADKPLIEKPNIVLPGKIN